MAERDFWGDIDRDERANNTTLMPIVEVSTPSESESNDVECNESNTSRGVLMN